MLEEFKLVGAHLGNRQGDILLIILVDSEHKHMAINGIARLNGLGLAVDTPGHCHAGITSLKGVFYRKFGYLHILDRGGKHGARRFSSRSLGEIVLLTQPQGHVSIVVVALDRFWCGSLFAGGLLVAAFLLTFFAGFLATLCYSFRPSTCRENPRLYAVLTAFAVFGVSIQIFMPYLIIYYEKTLGLTNYVLIMAPAILLAAAVTALYGRVIDARGFAFAVWPALGMLALGYVLLILTRSAAPVFVGSLLMMSGYLTGMSVFGARIRALIPEHRSGQFQGVRIIGQVFIPGLIGPAIGAAVLKNAQTIVNSDGTESFLPNANIFLAAVLVLVPLALGLALALRRKERAV